MFYFVIFSCQNKQTQDKPEKHPLFSLSWSYSFLTNSSISIWKICPFGIYNSLIPLFQDFLLGSQSFHNPKYYSCILKLTLNNKNTFLHWSLECKKWAFPWQNISWLCGFGQITLFHWTPVFLFEKFDRKHWKETCIPGILFLIFFLRV